MLIIIYLNETLEYFSGLYCTGIVKLNMADYSNSSPLMKLAFNIINNEVVCYQRELAGAKI
ncbi:MAG: hypothetical protein ISP01_01005 [Methanobrevibacter arboriphilus]|uniref:Uncharacterized protein n=1 Tax=Methanobrevibacter arboriphilus TaxID=39441 RepID=A0A843AKS7_METAZ|nr:hypothetical protein [Methanobrevibacter arboriphilus]